MRRTNVVVLSLAIKLFWSFWGASMPSICGSSRLPPSQDSGYVNNPRAPLVLVIQPEQHTIGVQTAAFPSCRAQHHLVLPVS